MRQRVRRLARWLLNPWGATVLVMVAWLAFALTRLSPGTMTGPDMPVILDQLREDHSLAAVWGWFTGPWVQSPDYYRPIVSVLHWADFMLWGDGRWGWGLTNALIIAATFPALTWLCSRGFRYAWAGPAAAVALIYLEPTANMIHWPAWRTDAVCGLFLLLATGAALWWLREGAVRHLWLTLGMLLLALMSKESALIWPGFVAVAVLLLARNRRGLVLLSAASALTGAFWLMRVHLLGHPLLGVLHMHVDFGIERQFRAFLHTMFDPVYIDLISTYPAVVGEPAFLLTEQFWKAVLADLAFIAANVLVAIGSLRLLGLIWSWRVITYLPSMPFARLWGFYYYIPTLGTALLYGVAVAVLVQRIGPRVRTWRERISNTQGAPEED